MVEVMNGDDFFEGTEKLLEVWFSSSNQNDKADIRVISRNEWDNLLDLVHCKIISKKSNSEMDSYILSESSMFISRNRVILKTCGTTTLLKALKPLLKLIKDQCSMDIVQDIFYSRKNFERPELQDKVHQSFDDETRILDELVEDGAAYALGSDHLLMTELDQDVMQIFFSTSGKTGKEATMKSGIDQIIPGATIDEFLFEPCGYSMNAIMPDSKYFTIHITPEKNFSYVSFESNVPQRCYKELLSKVLDLFRPVRFVMTVFANEASLASQTLSENCNYDNFEGYKRSDKQLCHFKNYYLFYAHFKK
ncbi:DgyrCDS9985 [Dimorphilus gyrociliatus]|uniref:adenosylmethionine decarboxylase n=1 Tax=Dimorphilus gyrociliatus TaxID=2664684 RepID=A0A7I8W1F0_9ANNE|nr:DgyrCDS9985 [Dimorphilus gyrociliatus]